MKYRKETRGICHIKIPKSDRYELLVSESASACNIFSRDTQVGLEDVVIWYVWKVILHTGEHPYYFSPFTVSASLLNGK